MQLSGFINHQKQSNPIYSEKDEDDSFKVTLGDWMSTHDPERYAYTHYGEMLHHIVAGVPFKARNIPPGYEYEPWTIKALLYKIERGEKLHFKGDWS